jgi:toxin-antitoxin system PIN domain toxin
MRIFDVNVLVYAFRPDLEHHARCLALLNTTREGAATFGVSELAMCGFVRIVTSKRVFRQPETSPDALAFCEALLATPNARPVRPGPRHWAVFAKLCRDAEARDKLVADAYHAALAMEIGAEWVSTDADFAKFPGLRWFNPLS